jgi:hypothetical protein
MKTSRIADEDSVSKEIKYIHTYIHTIHALRHAYLLKGLQFNFNVHNEIQYMTTAA